MAYLPGSKYKKSYTNGNNFIVKSTGEPYIGYLLELPDQKFFAGEDIKNVGAELQLIAPNSINIPRTRSNIKYGLLNKAYTLKERSYNIPVSSKTFPTQSDYTKGSMTRYFGYKIQTGRYFEVDKKTFEDIARGNKIDRSLYSSGKITWALKGDIELINGANLLRLDGLYPGLRKLFLNLSEFGI